MAYDLKYQSDFYNFFKTLVSVKIYKKDYGAHTVIPIRSQSVVMEVNYQDDITPVIGTGVKINIVNEGAFDSLEDLLVSTERQFKCIISYNGAIVFQGFSICDLNEQQFLPKAIITLQFTDYLRRLESDFLTGSEDDSLAPSDALPSLNDISEVTLIWSILMEAITKTGLQKTGLELPLDLHINSTLFEVNMDQGVDESFIFQTYIENVMLYKDSYNYDNTYTVLNKVLLSFGAFLYLLGDKFVLERIDDVTRDGAWVLANSILPTGSSTTSLKREYSKQNGDFEYVDESQLIEYDSGLKKLILKLNDKMLDTFVFNDYKTDMLTTVNYFPVPNSQTLKKWYIYYLNTAMRAGYAYKGMGSYFQWSCPTDQNYEYFGLYYAFEVMFNVSEDKPTDLSINFKMSGGMPLTGVDTAVLRFSLMVDGGPYSGYYVYRDGTNGAILLDPNPSALAYQFDVSLDKNTRVWTVNETFELTSITSFSPYVPSLWQQLSSPTKQRFIIGFYPIRYNPHSGGNYSDNINYLGDVQVQITQQEVLNKLTYYINEDFIKTATIDLDFFDLENTNFGNGPMWTNDGGLTFTKTKEWATYQYNTPKPLMDIYARIRFGNNFRTLHKLKGTILCDTHLKPFSILSDDNLNIDSYILKLILLGYTWNLVNGTYDIEALEFTEEEVVIDITEEIPTPVNLTGVQNDLGGAIELTWPYSPGPSMYYKLERMPHYLNGIWNDSWITIDDSINLGYTDNIQSDPIPDHTPVFYRVTPHNINGSAAASPIVPVLWLDDIS